MKLPRRQQQLHDLLLGRGDVPIVDLYTKIRGTGPVDYFGNQMSYMQRYLGPYITALNRSLAEEHLRVEPGALKNTYRLVAVTA